MWLGNAVMPTSRTLPFERLDAALSVSKQCRLPPSLLCPMEDRFAAPLSDVRIVLGALAAHLCRAIGARACAIGNAIYFSDGAWDPQSDAGVKLIAHELAHILQQRGALSDHAWDIGLGDPADPLEAEAERMAEAVLAGRTSPRATLDASGALRRSLGFDAKTATIKVNVDGSVPGVSVRTTVSPLCYMHLTRGAQEFLAPHQGVTARSASAINIKGQIVGSHTDTHDSPSDLSGWRFRMRQITTINELNALYVGPGPSDGGLQYDMTTPPLAPTFALGHFTSDAVQSSLPFMNDTSETVTPAAPIGVLVISNDMDDHPKWGLPLAKHNNDANRDDLLFEAERDQDFVSAFVAISPQNEATTLAHVSWRVSWKIRCKFVGITCLPTLVDKTFKVDPWQLGQPADKEQAALLTDLSGDYAHTANGWTGAAVRALDNLDVGVSFLSPRPPGVPTDFWLPRRIIP
jgi:hypothetical protein